MCSIQAILFGKTKTRKSTRFTREKEKSQFFCSVYHHEYSKDSTSKKTINFYSVSTLFFCKLYFYDTMLSVGNILYPREKSELFTKWRNSIIFKSFDLFLRNTVLKSTE